MRKQFLVLSKKLRYRGLRVYTWLLRSGLKHCGKRVRIEFPVRLEQPGRISIGDDVVLYSRTWINPVAEWMGHSYDGHVVIGDRSKIGYGVQISSAQSVVIEEDVAIAANAVIVDHMHDHMQVDVPIFIAPLSRPAPVRIGKGSFLGASCFIGPGVRIGEHASIGANAVVNKDVPDYSVAMGNPARVFRYHTPATEKNEDAASKVQVG